MCQLFWNLGTSNSWNPQGLFRPVMGLLYLYLYDSWVIAVDSFFKSSTKKVRWSRSVDHGGRSLCLMMQSPKTFCQKTVVIVVCVLTLSCWNQQSHSFSSSRATNWAPNLDNYCSNCLFKQQWSQNSFLRALCTKHKSLTNVDTFIHSMWIFSAPCLLSWLLMYPFRSNNASSSKNMLSVT